jgi:hypothetical protein
MTNLAVWYADVDVEEFRREFSGQMGARQRLAVDQATVKARARDSKQALGKLARVQDGQLRIMADPPLVVPIADMLPGQLDRAGMETQLHGLIGKYRRTLQSDRRVLLEQYDFVDMARKVVGVGSVGTRCWIILMLGRDEQDPLFLQAKEAGESVLSRFAGASKYANQGERVVAGQRLMQAASDIFLGWQRTTGLDGQYRDFYFRQLRDWKFSFPIEAMIPRGMRIYASLCGGTLAHTPAPGTGSRSPPTWVAPTSSTARSQTSPPPMPTRTSATTTRSARLPPPAGSPPSPASDPAPAG